MNRFSKASNNLRFCMLRIKCIKHNICVVPIELNSSKHLPSNNLVSKIQTLHMVLFFSFFLFLLFFFLICLNLQLIRHIAITMYIRIAAQIEPFLRNRIQNVCIEYKVLFKEIVKVYKNQQQQQHHHHHNRTKKHTKMYIKKLLTKI